MGCIYSKNVLDGDVPGDVDDPNKLVKGSDGALSTPPSNININTKGIRRSLSGRASSATTPGGKAARTPRRVIPDLHWKADISTDSAELIKKLLDLQKAAVISSKSPLGIIGLFDTTSISYPSSNGSFTPGLPRTGTFCQALSELPNSRPPDAFFTVPDALEDPRFATHPSVLHRPYTRSYAGVPLVSCTGHILGTLAAVDFQPREPPTQDQIDKLHEIAAEAVAALQRDVLEESKKCSYGSTGGGIEIETKVELPSLWVDVSTPEWTVLGGNTAWEHLTGIAVSTLEACPGLLAVLTPADDAELTALKVRASTADRSTTCSLPAILSPYPCTNRNIQFIMSLTPATSAPPVPPSAAPSKCKKTPGHVGGNIWQVEVQARLQSSETGQVSSSVSTIGDAASVDASQLSSGGTSGTPPPGPARLSSGDPGANSEEGYYFASSGGSGGPDGTRSSVSDLRVPIRLASLQLGPLLGRGSFGSVYKGLLKGKPVAVKIVEAKMGRDRERQMQEVQFEALVGLQKQQENVVPTLDWIKEESTGETWIVQELCDKGTLSAAYKEGLLRDESGKGPAVRAVLETAVEIARGMQYLHHCNVVHGDLSSNNVLLASADNDRGFVAKVTDFGLARLSDSELQTNTIGTVSHIAPELLMEGVMTKSSDVYSFGVILWELWTGKSAYQNTSVGQVIFAVTIKRQRLRLPEDAPPELVALVDECILEERTERPTFDEVVERLEKIIKALAAAA